MEKPMDYYYMLNEFIDGSLGEAEEQELFYALASADDLRVRMKHLLSINSAIKNAGEELLPPQGAKAAIFAAAGATLPVENAATMTSGDKVTPARGLFGRFTNGIIGLLSVSLILVTALFIKNNFTGNDVSNQKMFTLVEVPTNQLVLNLPGFILPSINHVHLKTDYSRPDKRNSVEARKQETHNIADKKMIASESTELPDPEILLQETELADALPVNETKVNDLISAPELNLPELSDNTKKPETAEQKDPSGFWNRFAVQAGGCKSWHLMSSPKPADKTSLFDNTDVQLLYYFSESFAVGLEFRKESFALKYQDTPNGIFYGNIYSKETSLETYGALLKFTNAGEGLRPFGEIALGYNNKGTALWLQSGVEYEIIRNLDLSLGIEYGNFIYAFEGRYTNSNKFGIRYGLSYNFR